MPTIYLSPSTQEYNLYVSGSGSEEYFMNLVADAMEPLLLLSGIQFGRNSPDMTAASSIRQANRGSYDFYLALHSNASGPGSEGRNRGIIAFYYPTSANGRRGAELIAENLRAVYPRPERVRIEATTTLGEVRQPRAPAVLVELGFHDNPEDAAWIESHIETMAESLSRAMAEYFGLPAAVPGPVRTGRAATPGGGAVNLRFAPEPGSRVLVQIPNGAELTVYGRYGDWYVAAYGGKLGYISAAYVRL